MNRKALPILLAFAFLLIAVGCATPRQSVATAELAYETTARAFAADLRAGRKYDTVTLSALQFANNEANAALRDANARVQKDARIGIEYAMARVDAALKHFADLYAHPEKATNAH